jgi:hypothetical protein
MAMIIRNANLSPIINAEGVTLLPVICGRCSGSGYWCLGHHNQNGICFGCKGKGTVGYETQADRDAREAEEKRQWEEKKAKLAKIQAKAEKALAADPELAKGFRVNNEAVASIHNKFMASGGRITEAQRDLVLKIADQEAKRDAKKAQWAAEEADRRANLTELEAGRQVIEGEIITLKEKKDFRGNWQVKILIQTTNGNRVFGTLPRALEFEPGPHGGEVAINVQTLRGKRIRLTATVEPKEIGFGFYKRPAKAELL